MHCFKTGVTSVTFRNKSISEIVRLAQRAGLDGIEWGGDVHVPPGDVSAAYKAAEETDAAGLSVLSYGSYFYGDEGVDFTPVLRCAKALGAPIIRIWAGRMAWEECPPAQFAQYVSCFQQAADLAAGEQISIAFEYHRNTLTQTKEGAAALLQAVQRPNAFCYWQPNPTISQEEQLSEIDLLLPWISNIHVFYWTGSHTRHPLASGAAPWQRYLSCLTKSPKSRSLILEFVQGDSEQAFLQDAQTLHSLVKTALFAQEGC